MAAENKEYQISREDIEMLKKYCSQGKYFFSAIVELIENIIIKDAIECEKKEVETSSAIQASNALRSEKEYQISREDIEMLKKYCSQGKYCLSAIVELIENITIRDAIECEKKEIETFSAIQASNALRSDKIESSNTQKNQLVTEWHNAKLIRSPDQFVDQMKKAKEILTTPVPIATQKLVHFVKSHSKPVVPEKKFSEVASSSNDIRTSMLKFLPEDFYTEYLKNRKLAYEIRVQNENSNISPRHEGKYPRMACLPETPADLIELQQSSQPPLISWSFPPDGWFKLNTDGSAGGRLGKSEVGGVLRDHTGAWIWGYQRSLPNCCALEEELKAIWGGLLLAVEFRVTNVIVESDSLLAVNYINNGCFPNFFLGKLVETCRDLVQKNGYRIQHAYREANHCADVLAKKGAELDEFVVLDDIPDNLSLHLLADMKSMGFRLGSRIYL